MMPKQARFLFLLMCLWLSLTSIHAQTGVRAVVVSEFANIRFEPALGAEVLASAPAGFEFEIITARSADSQWLRVIYGGEEGWVNITPIVVLSGDVSALPIADPRYIPYGGNEAPRAGETDVMGSVTARAKDNLRVRSGPSTAYPMIANIFYNEGFGITGRTASNRWYQVSFEGVLGWIRADYALILSGDVFSTPIDGIVAKAPINTGDDITDLIGTLNLILDRLARAQESLLVIRAYWTDAALYGRASCKPYPAQPSDLNLNANIMRAYFPTLDPLKRDFDDAIFNVRLAIDLFIEVCNQPGTGNPVGQATVRGALDTINLAESQINNLTERVRALLPPITDANSCLLAYQGRTEALPVINLNQLYLETFSRKQFTTGYCFDATQGQQINLQTLPLPESNVELFVSISPLDNPANFLGVNRIGTLQRLSIGPITIPTTGRYLIIISDVGQERAPEGKFAFEVFLLTAGITQFLTYDPTTGSIILGVNAAVTGLEPAGTVINPTPDPLVSTPVAGATPTLAACPSLAFTCNQLFTCAEAQACLAAGNFSLDPDGDGIPCEETTPPRCTPN